MATTDPLVMTVTTGVASGNIAGRNDYNYVGTFPGVLNPAGERFKGGAPLQKLVSYNTGVTAPWARQPIKFKV
jgi:hypothetical protein